MSKRPLPPEHFDDNPPLTDEEIARARPASQVLGKDKAAGLVRPQGRPPLPDTVRKQPVSIRLSPDVLDALRQSGRGWQSRADDMLREALGLVDG